MHAPGSPAARGWVLNDGELPQQADGLILLEKDDVPYDAPDTITPAAHGEGSAAQRYAVLWCDPAPRDPAITAPVLRLSTPAGATQLPCTSTDNLAAPVVPVPLPDGPHVLAQASWAGDVPRRGSAVLGVYREATWQEYEFAPVRPGTYAPPQASDDAVVMAQAVPAAPYPATPPATWTPGPSR